uniref:HIT family protein n=1 Tax=Flavobacterium sp. TaxID=239 RepID=UPI004047EEA1
MDCQFCDLPGSRVWFDQGTVIACRDAYPVSPGHALIIPKRHVTSLFELVCEEREDLFQALQRAKDLLLLELRPDGFNIGINDGIAAGQTIFHLHVHLIPRYQGDSEEPRGGVRWIFPDKAKYWS